ncbi:MAG: tetratricopeptide repeat protein [Myxococcota bacterium]
MSVVAALGCLLLLGGDCSRARVESMDHMNQGVAYAQQKRFIEAIKALQQSTVVDPTNDQAFYNLAIVHIEMQQFERAREALQSAINGDPRVAGYYEKLGTVAMELEDWDSARSAFEQAIVIEPELFKAYYKLAQVLEQADEPQQALHQYTEAIQRGPRFIEAYVSLGRLYYDLGFYSESAQVLLGGLRVVLPGTDEKADLHPMLGAVYQEQDRYDSAIEEFRSALELSPGMRDALFSLGWAHSLKGNREDARHYLSKFVDLAGADAPQHYLKAARDRIAELEQL